MPLEFPSSAVTKYRDPVRVGTSSATLVGDSAAAAVPTERSRSRAATRCSWLGMVLGTCCIAVMMLSAQTAPPLTLVSTAWPPFTNAAGQPRFALDLVETALGRIGRTTKTTIVAPGAFTRELLTGPYDGSGAAWKDEERERVLLFSDAYLENRLVLVGRHLADVSAKTLAELTGKRIAIVEGYSYGDAVDRGGPVFVRTRSEEDSLARLLKGDVDYTLMDDLVVQYIVSNYPKESDAKLQIGLTPVVRRELFLAIRRSRSDAAAIVAGFNAEIRRMITDRTYHRLLHVDWIRADINGDGLEENVPREDKVGPSSPERVYRLFSKSDSLATPGFYVGGTVYSDWASVPESYREVNPSYPDPRRSTASVFKFSW